MSEQPKFIMNGRIWIDTPNGKVLGHGRIELLERIHESGSIRQAALQMKMSYKQAWDLVKYINENINEPIVISKRGGKGGGKAEITAKGFDIIKQYKNLQDNFKQFLSEQSLLLNI
jgi:molybdate transport system regulatory protein